MHMNAHVIHINIHIHIHIHIDMHAHIHIHMPSSHMHIDSCSILCPGLKFQRLWAGKISKSQLLDLLLAIYQPPETWLGLFCWCPEHGMLRGPRDHIALRGPSLQSSLHRLMKSCI